MKISKAVITAAGRSQRTLPLQLLVDRDGVQKSVLRIILTEARQAGVEDICVVVCPDDEDAYRAAAGQGEGLCFVPQPEPRGYGHALHCARGFVGSDPFLHMVGDHIYISDSTQGSARQLVETAQTHSCAVSGVQSTRENQLNLFGAVGGQRIKGTQDLYVIEHVLEKPTPTEAEQTLIVPGLRAGHYLCFFGIHVFTPSVMEILHQQVAADDGNGLIQLSPVLAEVANREQYLALETRGRRYPVDARYGLLNAQIGLALSGPDRADVLAGLCELLAQREMGRD